MVADPASSIVCFAILSLSAPSPQNGRAIAGAVRDDMIKAVCRLHCLVFVGTGSTEQSGHLKVPGLRPHDQGCMLLHCLVLLATASHGSGATSGCPTLGHQH